MSVLRSLALSAVLLALGVTVLMVATNGFHAFTSEAARNVEVREHPRPVPAAVLENQAGQNFTLTSLRGKWLVVDFMYTRCLSLCMVMGSQFAQLQRQLAAPIAKGRVELLSISFDPAHDGPVQLKGYLERFGRHGTGWVAAVPRTPKGLAHLKRVFGITVVPDGEGGFVHNDGFEIVNPQGRLMRIIGVDVPGTTVAHVVQGYLPQ